MASGYVINYNGQIKSVEDTYTLYVYEVNNFQQKLLAHCILHCTCMTALSLHTTEILQIIHNGFNANSEK